MNRRINGLLFIVDILFIITFLVVLSTTPGPSIEIRGKAKDDYMLIVGENDDVDKRAIGGFWRIPCQEELHAVCKLGEIVIIHGEMFRVVSELFFMVCGFENRVCSVSFLINQQGLIDVGHFRSRNNVGPCVTRALLKKFPKHGDLFGVADLTLVGTGKRC